MQDKDKILGVGGPLDSQTVPGDPSVMTANLQHQRQYLMDSMIQHTQQLDTNIDVGVTNMGP